jgi:hypothetical protein
MIVTEHSAESLAPFDWGVEFANDGERLQQPVLQPPLPMSYVAACTCLARALAWGRCIGLVLRCART